MTRKQIIREKYVLKQLLMVKSTTSVSLSHLSELTRLNPKELEEVILNLIKKSPQIGNYDRKSENLHLNDNSEIMALLESYPERYYEYLPLIRDNKEITEEESQYILIELLERITDKLKTIAAVPDHQNIPLSDLAELNLRKEKISIQETNLLRETETLMNHEGIVSREILLKLDSMHIRLIHVVKWLCADDFE